MEYGRWILSQESASPCGYDSLNQIWAGGTGSICDSNSVLAGISLDNYQIGNGTVSLKIIDRERFANINTANSQELQQTLSLMGVGADSISVVSDSILDWIDTDDAQRLAGAESDYYQGLAPAYHAKNAPLDDLSELLLVKDVTPEMYYGPNSTNVFVSQRPQRPKLGLGHAPGEIPEYSFGFVDVFTPISAGLININTAGTNVLQIIPGIDAQIAATIIQHRAGPDGIEGTGDDEPYRSLGELATAGVNPQIIPQLGNYCTVRSQTFEVHVTARIGQSSREFVALLFRNSGTDVEILSFYWH
jgi:general secretion pathway protein K